MRAMHRPPDPRAPADAGASLWDVGWYRHAVRRPSPNHGPRPPGTDIDLVVIHAISLPPGDYGGDAIERLFANTLDWDAHPYFATIRGLQVSAHFVVRREGTLMQFVSCDDRAWHAGRSRFRGRDECNDYAIGIELEGLDGDVFEPAQYETLAALMAALPARYPIAYVAGHEHVAPARKRDPGPGFSWAELQRQLGWDSRCFPVSSGASDPPSERPVRG